MIYNIFKHWKYKKEQEQSEIRDRIISKCEDIDCGVCPPPIDPYIGFFELASFLLDREILNESGWDVDQVIADCVYEIECEYYNSHARLYIVRRCNKGYISNKEERINPRAAIHELTNFLLGEDYYVVMPVSADQANTEIIYEIETFYLNSDVRRRLLKKHKYNK